MMPWPTAVLGAAWNPADIVSARLALVEAVLDKEHNIGIALGYVFGVNGVVGGLPGLMCL